MPAGHWVLLSRLTMCIYRHIPALSWEHHFSIHFLWQRWKPYVRKQWRCMALEAVITSIICGNWGLFITNVQTLLHKCLTFPTCGQCQDMDKYMHSTIGIKEADWETRAHAKNMSRLTMFPSMGWITCSLPHCLYMIEGLDLSLLINWWVEWLPLCLDLVICWKYYFCSFPGEHSYKFPTKGFSSNKVSVLLSRWC